MCKTKAQFGASKQDPIVHNEVALMNFLNTRGVCHTGKTHLLLEFVECMVVILSYNLGQKSTFHLWHQFLNLIVIYFGFCERHLGNFSEKVCETTNYKAVTPYSPAEI